MGAVAAWFQSDCCNPITNKPTVLTRRDVRTVIEATWENERAKDMANPGFAVRGRGIQGCAKRVREPRDATRDLNIVEAGADIVDAKAAMNTVEHICIAPGALTITLCPSQLQRLIETWPANLTISPSPFPLRAAVAAMR